MPLVDKIRIHLLCGGKFWLRFTKRRGFSATNSSAGHVKFGNDSLLALNDVPFSESQKNLVTLHFGPCWSQVFLVPNSIFQNFGENCRRFDWHCASTGRPNFFFYQSLSAQGIEYIERVEDGMGDKTLAGINDTMRCGSVFPMGDLGHSSIAWGGHLNHLKWSFAAQHIQQNAVNSTNCSSMLDEELGEAVHMCKTIIKHFL